MSKETERNIGILILGVCGLIWGLGPFKGLKSCSGSSDRSNSAIENTYSGGSDISFTGSGKTCRSHGCDCTITRSELESGGLLRCSCGHITDWHHD